MKSWLRQCSVLLGCVQMRTTTAVCRSSLARMVNASRRNGGATTRMIVKMIRTNITAVSRLLCHMHALLLSGAAEGLGVPGPRPRSVGPTKSRPEPSGRRREPSRHRP